MSSQSSKAIVLSMGEFGEADRYVQFLTQKWGVISTLAKAARKSKRRYVGGLDLFCHDEIFVRGDPKEKPYLIELTVLNSFPGIRESLDRVLVAGRLVQWIRKLVNITAPVPGIYSLLGQTLALLEKQSPKERLERLELIFKIKLVTQLGLAPKVDVCVLCAAELSDPISFDLSAGGAICPLCKHKAKMLVHTPLSLEQRGFLLATDQTGLKHWEELVLSPKLVQPLNYLMTQFASYHHHLALP